MKVKCGHCAEEHDISQMEPAFALPDCIAAMSPRDSYDRHVLTSKNICSIRSERRGFIRVLLPIPVKDHAPCNWGVWVEPEYADFVTIVEAWTDLALLNIRRQAKLANELQTYPGSLGLPGVVHFPNMSSIGRILLMTDHALTNDQINGVTIDRKLEWLLTALHPDPANGS